jgi:hypothetical protein
MSLFYVSQVKYFRLGALALHKWPSFTKSIFVCCGQLKGVRYHICARLRSEDLELLSWIGDLDFRNSGKEGPIPEEISQTLLTSKKQGNLD